MMDTARSTQNYISHENREESVRSFSESFEESCQSSLSEDETSLT